MMREAWVSLGSPLNGLLCMTKWLNICLLHGSQASDVVVELLNKTCLPALKSASDPKASEYVADPAFKGLLTDVVKDPASLMPQVFNGKNSTPISNQPSAVTLTAGTLGVKDKASGKAKSFGTLDLLTAFAAKAGGTGADDDEESLGL